MLSTEVQKIADEIGDYYLAKNNGNRDAANEEIVRCRYTDIRIIGDTVELVTRSPGFVLGRLGTNPKAMERVLGRIIKIVETPATVEDLMLRTESLDEYLADLVYMDQLSEHLVAHGLSSTDVCLCGHEAHDHATPTQGRTKTPCESPGCDCADFDLEERAIKE